MDENPLHKGRDSLLEGDHGATSPDLRTPSISSLDEVGRSNSRMVSFDGLRGPALRSLQGSLASSSLHVLDEIPSAATTTTPQKQQHREGGTETAPLDKLKSSISAAGSLIERWIGVDSTHEMDRDLPLLPQMFKWNYIGLYSHYAGVGFTGGMLAVSSNFCFYYYNGANNVCANASSLMAIGTLRVPSSEEVSSSVPLFAE